MEKGLTKQAGIPWKAIARWGGLGTGMGAGNALLWDWLQNDSVKDLFTGDAHEERYKRLAINALTGALGAGTIGIGKLMKKPELIGAGIMEPLVATPLKDALIPVPEALHAFTRNNALGTALKAGLGLGALGIGGAALVKYLSSNSNGGEVAKARYKIQGKKGDPYSDAEVEVPINDPDFSDAMLADIGKNIRQQARKNNKYNSTKIDPKTGQPIPYEEWDQKYGNMSEEALAQLKQETGAFKNTSTDDESESSEWLGKEAAMLYLTGQFKSAGATPSNPIPAIVPPQPIQPMGPAQPPAPTTPPPAQAPQPPAPTANGSIPLSPYPPKSHGQNLTRYIQPGETPPPSTGIKPFGQEDPKVLQKNMDRITRDIQNIAAKFNKGQAPSTQM